MQRVTNATSFSRPMPAGTRRDRTAALAVVGVWAVLFALRRAVWQACRTPVRRSVGELSVALAINDLIHCLFHVSQFAISPLRRGIAAARERIFVQRPWGGPE